MSFSISHMIADLAFFVAPAIAVTLTEDEKRDLASLESRLAHRKTELAMFKKNPKMFAKRISLLNRDIAQFEDMIADYRHVAKVRYR